MATTKRLPFGLLVCVVCFRLALGAEMTVDLRTGERSTEGSGMTWLSAPETRSSGGACDLHGLLKITFKNKLRAVAHLKMEFDDPTNFSFDFGDSETNDGWGGDAGTQEKNAEVFAYNRELIIAGADTSDKPGTEGYEYIYRGDFVFPSGSDENPVTILYVNVSNNVASAYREDGSFFYFNSFKLFNLRGQADSVGDKNRDVFLGFNRVVSDLAYNDGAGSVGTGLCRVELTWFSEEEMA